MVRGGYVGYVEADLYSLLDVPEGEEEDSAVDVELMLA